MRRPPMMAVATPGISLAQASLSLPTRRSSLLPNRAANVPAALAWQRIQAGAIGTRNAFMLAFDCFHPQWDPKHLWLQPLTQAVALQRTRDVRYADWVLRFEPTLSPVTLVPGPETVDMAIGWGRAAIEPLIPMLERSLEPVWWERPPERGSDRWKFWRRALPTG